MAEFTKEQLIERARENVNSLKFASTQHAFEQAFPAIEIDIRLAEIALAALTVSMEQEPIYQLRDVDWYDTDKRTYDTVVNAGGAGRIVYAAPQLPHPAVPDEAEMPSGPGVPEYNVGWANGWNSCREEMLQGAEPVRQPLAFFDGDISPEDAEKIIARLREMNCRPGSQQVMIAEPVSQPYTLREGLAAIRELGTIDADKIQAERDALNEPNLREGWVAVPVEPTPEMLAEICLVDGWTERALQARYKAMLAAAPQQEAFIAPIEEVSREEFNRRYSSKESDDS